MSTKEQDFDYFLEALKKAATKIDQEHYFRLPVSTKKGTKEVFRERVYCYELYHQLRVILGEGFPYKLHGEVDKAGHEILPGERKPDFIVHDPGDMNRNLLVIEVKPVNVKNHLQDLEKDLETLEIFLGEKGRYCRGIMLVYGDGYQCLPKTIQTKVAEYSKRCRSRILLVWHKGVRIEPEIIYFE